MANTLLDDRQQIATLDSQNMLGSIEQIGSQIQQMWDLAKTITFTHKPEEITNVVVAGMGGSVLGTHVIQTVFKNELKVPVVIAPDYEVPSFVNEHTLVIASSYSGTTEETLAAIKDAQAKGAQICGITSGGPLAEWLRTNGYQALVFDPTYNPCNAPRMGLGYSIFGQMALFSAAGLLQVDQKDFEEVLEIIAAMHLSYGVDVAQDSNAAKLLAFQMLDRIPIVTVAEHLEGMAHVFANQLNENAKNYSEFRVIPEINHHLLEGIQFPESNQAHLLFVTTHSDLYALSNQRRLNLTEDIFDQKHVDFVSHTLTAKTKITQAFEFLMLAAYSSYYLALLNNQNPTPIPSVDWLKAELKKAT